jgi:hypothetical protein
VVSTQVWNVQGLPIKGGIYVFYIPNNVLKVGVESLLLCLVISYTVATTIFDVCNVVSPPPLVCFEVEKLSTSVSFLQPYNPRSMPPSRYLYSS